AACRFCHEFHPRKCNKKNKRILKRLGTSEGGQGEGQSISGPSPDMSKPFEETDSVVKSLTYLKEVFADKTRAPRATFVVGQKVRLHPWVETSVPMTSELQDLMDSIVFSVDPPLP
ncbi:unnamed protein product, partial [Polarella glacialis]